jgi:hypothetical protein
MRTTSTGSLPDTTDSYPTVLRTAVMRYLTVEVPAQINATEPAFGGSYRSDDLCATAACEPRPYRAFGRAPWLTGSIVGERDGAGRPV